MTTTTPLKTYESARKVSLMHDASMEVKAPAGLSEAELKSYIRDKNIHTAVLILITKIHYDYEIGI